MAKIKVNLGGETGWVYNCAGFFSDNPAYAAEYRTGAMIEAAVKHIEAMDGVLEVKIIKQEATCQKNQ
jgi:hypothetical protein